MKVIVVFLAIQIILVNSKPKCLFNLNENETAPSQFDSTKFFKCVTNGEIRLLRCPFGLTYDRKYSKCMRQSRDDCVGCVDGILDTPAPPVSPDDPIDTTPPPNEQDCVDGELDTVNPGANPIPDDFPTTPAPIQCKCIGNPIRCNCFYTSPAKNIPAPVQKADDDCVGCVDGSLDTPAPPSDIDVTPPPSETDCVDGDLDTGAGGGVPDDFPTTPAPIQCPSGKYC